LTKVNQFKPSFALNNIHSDIPVRPRLFSYGLVALLLVAGYLALRGHSWTGSAHLHTIMETVATLLAFVVGAMALVRYYSRKSNTFLVIGTGFLGTGLLDGHHALVTSEWLSQRLPSALSSLIPWSWMASRFFLSAALLLSGWIWRREAKLGTAGRFDEKTVYSTAAGAALLSFLFFAFVPLPPSHHFVLLSPFFRPQEFFPAILFLLALIGYLRKGRWKTDSFEHWMILSLIVSFESQAVFMPLSSGLFDLEFNLAHVLKCASYVCVLTGLMINMYSTYRQAENEVEIRMAAEAKAERLALFDELTGLENRRSVQVRIEQALAASRRHGWHGALLFLDLDNFKNINDSLGHSAGDTLLQQIAHRLVSLVRSEDTVARYGGDEFVILLCELADRPENARDKCWKIAEKVLASLEEPYRLGDHSYHVTSSIGIALFPDADGNGEDLLKHADMAMYRSKHDGRNAIRFYNPQMHKNAQQRLALEQELRDAIDRLELRLHFQPQFDLHSGRPSGAEVLMRWLHPERGLIGPSDLISLAEESRLILPIGEWIVGQTAAYLRCWEQTGLLADIRTVSVNLSPVQFRHPQLVETILRILAQQGVDPRLIALELTENVVMEDLKGSLKKMRQLKEAGVRLSLDDFGTGYSSLAYLKQLPLDELKIDRSFIRSIGHNQQDAAIVEAIVNLAQHLDLDAVAEGIETADQLAFLQRIYCRFGQGYYLQKPIDAGEFEAFLGRDPEPYAARHTRIP
jgi:diguanylate cyclase (GGDEF)-like protein